ncbi:gamma tubulin complex Spc97/GCP2 subunit Alp4 [Exophiala dermatitidis]|nr:gamma tubulin complex Spc97/GCP2 subunit Alp4 [Exophiala dermatitidis]KAJ4523039.1 gamma tubulin complex Spc97/GCP2 subunit Alp4 [Exophiala dermatitidis]KAJ4526363.1 gamma tubulin complex Spc97/GCP2 subunit Alp4 [Exophiala dermatitidis]KAJ4532396.1 gamma tubulin complex Spc97/GCP2 subunit Alp4 [Exophiala dermatitidis]KAJ4546437.1 gamma tubulin complex Spc97/GCP2 subunit Alp4 [Exophiala dermatitidis]
MASMHYRSASAAERRSSHLPDGPSRVNSTRSRHYERPFTRDTDSPIYPTAYSEVGEGTHKHTKSENRFSGVERRREKSIVTTTETLVTRRSPRKESSNVESRRTNLDRRRSVGSPVSKRPPKDEDTEGWAPTVSLIPHSSAPLATRVTAPPLSRTAPSTLDPMPLETMSMQEQERVILDDLLYVFMGFEGQYIRFRDIYNPSDEKDRLNGPTFHPLPGLDPSLKDLTSSMLSMATHHCALEAFTEVQSREEFGSVNQALCAAIRNILKDFLILVAQLEMKVLNDPSFTLHKMHIAVIPTMQCLAQLYSLAQELLKKNSLLDEDIDDSIDDFDADNIIERLKEGGDLLPGSLAQKKCIGGNVLGLLTHRLSTFSGDPAARRILEMLLRESSRPYMVMLNEWLHHGGIKDPHSEFLIGERASIKRERLDEDYTDEYWEKRYYIRDKTVPPQLEAVKEKVLLAGKYLNVVRECGGVNVSSKIVDTPATFDDPRFLDNVNNAYSFANRELLHLLLTKNSLRSRLRSLKHYFFQDRAEFFLYFLELSESELRKKHRDVNVGKLQSLLDLVLHQPGSIAVADPFKEDVKVKLNSVGLTQWLIKVVNVQGMDQDNPESVMDQYKTPGTAVGGGSQAASTEKARRDKKDEEEKDIIGFDALELDYTVPFPLSLIISRKTVMRYQLIFRYTLALRHLETQLVACWATHTKERAWNHKSSDRRFELWKRRVWTLRSRMLVFVQQMLFFATAEVIEPNWQKLMVKVDEAEREDEEDEDESKKGEPKPTTAETAEPLMKQGLHHPRPKPTVDELMQDHVDMLDSCMKDLGLTQAKLLRLHAKLMTGCGMFAAYVEHITKTLYEADTSLQAAQQVGSGSNRTTAAAAPAPPTDPARMKRIEESIRKYEEHFNRHLKILIDALNWFATTETVSLLSLCGRLTNAEVQRRDDLFL